MSEMTPDEITVVEKLADAFNAFVALSNSHPNDRDEFAHHIHILQRQVMARLARRAHPDIFPVTNQ
jgi:hypothetical protein